MFYVILMVQTKLFSDLYLVKFLDSSAKNRSFRVKILFIYWNILSWKLYYINLSTI